MQIRTALAADAKSICELVNYYAERGRMLHLSLESIYHTLRSFQVAVDETGQALGCGALDVYWADLAEVKSLAVAPQAAGRGLGRKLVDACLADARRLGIGRVFALTYEQTFFEKCGFEVIDKSALPEKVWRVCINCPKKDCCDEIAMIAKP